MDDRSRDNPITGLNLTHPRAGPVLARPQPEFPLSLFLAPQGVRAGWRLVAFVVMATVLGVVFLRLIAALAASGLHPLNRLAQQSALVGAVLLPAWILGRLEGRSLADYALPARGAFGARFWQGVLWGFLALTALLELLHLGHAFDFGSGGIRGAELGSFAAAWAVVFLLVGIFEEFATRGYALFTLTTGMGFWGSAVLLSVAFGALHLGNRGEDWIGALAAALIGLFWCLTVRRTGSLWFAIGMHASWDYAESFIYGVPDSGALLPGHFLNPSFHGPAWLTGGRVGPEGSILVFGLIGAMFLIFERMYRQARFPRR